MYYWHKNWYKYDTQHCVGFVPTQTVSSTHTKTEAQRSPAAPSLCHMTFTLKGSLMVQRRSSGWSRFGSARHVLFWTSSPEPSQAKPNRTVAALLSRYPTLLPYMVKEWVDRTPTSPSIFGGPPNACMSLAITGRSRPCRFHSLWFSTLSLSHGPHFAPFKPEEEIKKWAEVPHPSSVLKSEAIGRQATD